MLLGQRQGREMRSQKGHFQEQGLLDQFPKGEHLILVVGLDSGDDCGYSRQDSACYKLLNRGVHNVEVSCDLFETGD